MKTIQTICDIPNATAIDIGPLSELKDYELELGPGIKIPGKVFGGAPVKAGGADTTKTKKVRAYRYSPGESQIETEIPDYLTETEIAYSTKYVDNKTDNTFTVNGQTVDFVAATWTSVIPNIFLFRLNNAGSLYSGVKAVVGMKLYSFKIIEGDAAKMDFVPCLRNSDSAAGLYDTVGNAFYANAGSGGSFGYEAKKGPGFVIVIK